MHIWEVNFPALCYRTVSFAPRSLECIIHKSLLHQCLHVCYTAYVCKALPPVLHANLSAPFALIGDSVQAVCEVGFWFEDFTFEVSLECTDGAVWNDTLQDCTGTILLCFSQLYLIIWGTRQHYLFLQLLSTPDAKDFSLLTSKCGWKWYLAVGVDQEMYYRWTALSPTSRLWKCKEYCKY